MLGDVRLHAVGRRRWRPGTYRDLSHEAAFGWQAFAHGLRNRYDVWHATSVSDAAAAIRLASLRPGMRTVFTDHGFPARRSRDRRPDKRQFDRVVKSVDSYICVSQPAADYLKSDYGRNATVIAPGVDVDRFAVGTVRETRPTILYAGSLTESRKNVDLLLAAADVLLAARPDAQLWLLGQGDSAPLLGAATPRVRAAVTAVGALEPDQLADRYQRAWVTVLPSDAEVFGMVLTESLACGTPGVALDDGLGPSTILDRSTGRLAQRSPEGLAAALDEALDLAQSADVRTACRSRAEQFDWRRVIVPAIESVYLGAA